MLNPLIRRAWASTSQFRLVLLLVVAMFAFFALTQPAFSTSTNVQNLVANSSLLWVVAMGMTFVLLSGGFDLSVGATAALTGILMAKSLELGIPGPLVVVLCVAAGALVGGLLNGVAVGKVGLSVFVVTLATMTSLTGVVSLWSGSNSFLVTAPAAKWLATERFLGLPMPIWIMAAVFLVALYVQNRTYFGRDVYAIGGSATAARLSGIHVPRTLIIVYAVAGACAALAGTIGVGRVGAAVPTVDSTLALQAIAAVLLGGTALTGGSGGVGGTALGVLFIAILQNGLSLAGVASDWQNVVTGVILIVAVAGDRIDPRLITRRRSPSSTAVDRATLSASSRGA
ncbi:ABC transporter permease [Nocardioides aquiterrae]|uniref:ABC transporter permease n=1 Tax=Nocardioides aquiterrae TaxID=203799 RepID=A0ABP4EV72_9ACTN